MEQYLQALRDREDVSEEVILELEERFKEPEQEVFEKGLTEVEKLRVETAESNAEMFEMVLMMLGGMM